MRPTTYFVKSFVPIVVVTMAVAIDGGGRVAAQSAPDSENGRYSMTPTSEGALRLDSRTGAVSTCSKNDAGWACYAVPDERAALDAEIGRLQAEVERLKAQPPASADSGRIDEALPKSGAPKRGEPKVAEGERKIEIPLPSDQDLDRMMSVLERAWRRLIEMADRVQKDVSGRI